MSGRRVVVTGAGAISALGSSWAQIRDTLAGGAEELCITEATVFDVTYATSTQNQ